MTRAGFDLLQGVKRKDTHLALLRPAPPPAPAPAPVCFFPSSKGFGVVDFVAAELTPFRAHDLRLAGLGPPTTKPPSPGY